MTISMKSIWLEMLNVMLFFNHVVTYEATLSNGLNVYEIKCKDRMDEIGDRKPFMGKTSKGKPCPDEPTFNSLVNSRNPPQRKF